MAGPSHPLDKYMQIVQPTKATNFKYFNPQRAMSNVLLCNESKLLSAPDITSMHIYIIFQATFTQDHTEHNFLTLSSCMFMFQLKYIANVLQKVSFSFIHFFQLA